MVAIILVIIVTSCACVVHIQRAQNIQIQNIQTVMLAIWLTKTSNK